MIQQVRWCLASVAQCAAEAASTDLQWLSEHEQSRLVGITAPRRRKQFLAGHWLMRRALAAFTGVEGGFWPLGASAAGAPLVVSKPALHLALSHSADWVVCAVSDAAVGVDIEAPQRGRDFACLAPMVYSEIEMQEAVGLNAFDAARQFYRVWTLKEAWFKLRGEALSMDRLPGLHTCAALEGVGNARVWHSAEVTLALVAAPDACWFGDGLANHSPSWWQVDSGHR